MLPGPPMCSSFTSILTVQAGVDQALMVLVVSVSQLFHMCMPTLPSIYDSSHASILTALVQCSDCLATLGLHCLVAGYS